MQTMAGATALAALGDSRMFALETHGPTVGAAGAEGPWFQQPLRILQTVLRETDARGYDPAAVVRYLQEAACNTLVVNAGGIVDFFQNPLPAANVNRFMGDRDLLKEIVTACRAAGIRVIGRVDFRGVEEHVYRHFPDWFSLDAAGRPLQLDYTRPRLYASCYTGVYRNEHAEAFIRHLLTHYPLDGIWHNSIGVGGICYCARCREAFKQATGAALPAAESAPGAELDRYMTWKTAAAEAHMRRMRDVVKSFGPEKAYAAEVFGMFDTGGRVNSGIDLYQARDHFDYLVSFAFLTEIQEPLRYVDLNYAGTLVRFLKSMAPEKETVILYGGNGTAHRYVMDPPVDLRIWVWEALAAGGRFWNCYFNGSAPDAAPDRRNAFINADAYRLVRDHEKLFAHHAPVANVAIYYSRPTRLFYREASPEGDRFGASIKGVENVLVENHVPYEFVADDQLSAERLQRYRVLILPNVRCLSDAEIAVLRGYVRSGGRLVATYATSLHDEAGKPRGNFGLGDVFGCDFTGERADTRKDCYQFIARPDHPLVAADSGATELLVSGGYTLLCRPRAGAEVICTYVPAVPNQPPEKAWVEAWAREFPTVVWNRYGEGEALYFANQPDQIAYELGHPDARNLLIRGVRLLAGGTLPLESDAPESVHLGLTRSTVSVGEYLLSFVNTTSGPERPVRRLLPVFGVGATVRVGGTLESYDVLRTQGICRVEPAAGAVRVTVERLEDFCAVHLRMRA